MESVFGFIFLLLCLHVQPGRCGALTSDDKELSGGTNGTKERNGMQTKASFFAPFTLNKLFHKLIHPFRKYDKTQSTSQPMEGAQGTIKWPVVDSQPDSRQSPIDLITSFIVDIRTVGVGNPVLTISHHSYPGKEAKVKNTGETVKVSNADIEREKLPFMENGPLKKKFIFEQMHFHWGEHDDWGSEHMIDAEGFAAEIHLVHYNSEYTNFEEALEKDDGLCVLTLFVKAEDADNLSVKPLHGLIEQLQDPQSERTTSWDDVFGWVKSGITSNKDFYTYPGSLTTPPFKQNVVFVILPEPITISHKQLRAFRELHDDPEKKSKEGLISANNRRVQPRNHRSIFKGRVQTNNVS